MESHKLMDTPRLLESAPRVDRDPVPLTLGRLIDIFICSVALVFLAPLMLTVALLVKLQDGGPALFAQRRIGKDGRYFRCLKFRSMVLDADARLQHLLNTDPQARAEWEADHKLRKDPRITSLGAFLRKSSIDELPQLINVLRGDMNLVGPRPIVDAEVVRYGRAFRYYCAVRPGITGLWQISGRNEVTYSRRVAMDVTYARNRNLALDMKILFGTVPSVLLSKGAY